MGHLSSCYFCGTALDEPLGTYGVGEGTTVTLCPTCRRKLGTILGTAGGSLSRVDEPQPAPVAGPDDAEGSPAREPDGDSGADTDAESDDDTERVDDEEAPETETGRDTPEAVGSIEEAGDTAEVSLSALEYNKVMRLLQNREFPVDRAEIETVATNAYDLSQSECAAVIDLAIDRGLLDETDGQLSRPE
ncbi:MAG: hypothetical protein V5A55_10060 [Halovenus sp.]